MGSGDSDRTAVFTRYQLSVKKSDRLSGTWTLEQYERCYERAFYSIVKEAYPDWKPGQKFNARVLDGITREQVESRIVQAGNTLTLTSGNAVDVKAQLAVFYSSLQSQTGIKTALFSVRPGSSVRSV